MVNPGTPRGLATLAMLKARFDAGQDQIGLLEPFVEDILPLLGSGGFGVAECKDTIEREHGLVVPQDVLSTVLQRVTRSGKLRRDAGRYWLVDVQPRSARLPAEREAAEREFTALASALAKYAETKGSVLRSEDDALVFIVAFLVDNDVILLMDELTGATALRSTALTKQQTKLVASFIRDVALPNAYLAGILDRLLRGIILQDALLLRSIAQPERAFADTTAYFDTGFLFGLIGAKGESARLAARESLELLRASGAKLAAFRRTVDEMRRILQVYERHLATADGRLTLRSSDLTYHFLAIRATPSDVRQLGSLAETTILGAGVALRDLPRRDPQYVLDEAALQRELAQPHQTGDEPRILHDVDCIAAVLQYRRGQNPTTLERCVAIFATSSGSVVRSVNGWFRHQGDSALAQSFISWHSRISPG